LSLTRKSKSILEEISTFIPEKSKEELIESRANHIIFSAIHLLESIEENYTEEESELLKKRFISSIRGSDPKRFSRMVKRIKNGEIEDDDDIE